MSISPPGGDLTGVWRCDDGGLYYIRQAEDGSVTWAGLQDSGFHKGMGFTNVLLGSLSADGKSITGEWADVPRGATANSGTIVLSIVDDVVTRSLERVPGQTTGGFGGSVWLPTGPSLAPQDIVWLDNQVQRYDKPLGQNNPPCRDFSVMWGTISQPTGPTLPDPNDYCTFVNSGRGWWNGAVGWSGDGDFTFDLAILWATEYPNGTDWADFWQNGWVTEQPSAFSDPPATHIARLYDKPPPIGGQFHCEAAMYGRQNLADCADAPMNLLPGWNELSGWSVLVNGRPVEGKVTVADNPDNPTTLMLSFPLWPDGKAVDLKPGAIARVTGVVADDAGHEGQTPPEIHPIYAIDIRQNFISQPRTQPVTLSGVWHGSDNGTYYVRQLGHEVWWLGLSRDQGRSFANVFHGSIGSTPLADSGPIEGEWLDVPMGADGTLNGGTLVLRGDQADTQLSTTLTKSQSSATFGAETWTKIYDTEGMPVGPPLAAGPLPAD